MNPLNAKDRQHWWRAVKTSRQTLEPFRNNRKKLVEAYVGGDYGSKHEDKHKTLVDLMGLTAETYTFALAANRPRVLISTRFPELKAFSLTYQTAVNNLIEEIHLEETLRRIVMDAFFSVGIAKVYLAPDEPQEMLNPEFPQAEPGMDAGPEEWEQYRQAQTQVPLNVWVDPGKPMVERVSLDDFIFDTQAECWEKIRFAMHEYRVPFSDLEKDERFDPEVVKMLSPNSKWGGPQDRDANEPVRNLTTGSEPDHDELEPMITLADVWLPREKKWLVMAPEHPDAPPLFVDDWDGPESGPFHLLTFGDVPDNIMPKSPASNLLALHDLANSLMRKADRQARNQKTVFAYTGDGKDAKQVRDAHDMQLVRVNNPENIKELKYNGVSRETLAFQQVIDGVFSRMAGNLDAMAGLGPQSGTATQDQLIHGAVSKREAKMQYRVVDFTAKLCRDLGWMIWVDEVKTIPGQRKIEGVSQPIDATWTPEEREGDYAQYNFSIEPYSMAYQSPSQRMQTVISLLQSVFLPMQEQLQMAGGMIDMKELTEMLSDLSDEPRLKQIIAFASGMVSQESPRGEPPAPSSGKPPVTTREYVRRGAPGGSPQGERTVALQGLLSGAGGEQ